MHKIESSIVKSIHDFQHQPTAYRADNHAVISERDTIDTYTMGSWHLQDAMDIIYRLHGHAIFTMSIDKDGDATIILSDCGWRTATTKSRLNAILSSVMPGYGIYQKDFGWYISDQNGVSIPFFNGIQYAI